MTELRRDSAGSYRHPDDTGEPSTGLPRVSVTDQEAAILAGFVEHLEVLELGTGLGVSTRALASTAAQVHTVDPDPWVHVNVWPTLPFNVTTGEDRAPWINVFDAVFVDADHSTEATRADVLFARCAVKPTGLILVHDVNHGHVLAGLGDLDRWELLDTEHGIGVLRLEGDG